MYLEMKINIFYTLKNVIHLYMFNSVNKKVYNILL